MMALLLEEKPEETYEKAVEGIMVCIECGSPNTTILTKAIYCRDCRSFKIFRKRKPSEFLSQNGKPGVFRVK
jgi:DNA-directed RNA polymerase subunit RPC12/RpoP